MCIHTGFTQTYLEYQKKYAQAKESFTNKKYLESLVLFDELAIKANENPFMPYAKFYKAYAYINLSKFSDARFTLVKLKEELPEWSKVDEVNYLLEYAQLSEKQYIEAHTTLESIRNIELSTKSRELFYHWLSKEENIEILIQTQNRIKKDKEIAQILVSKIYSSNDLVKKALKDNLIQEFNIQTKDLKNKIQNKKDSYTIALFLPFSINNPRAYLNTPSLNIKDGVQYALDSLKKIGITIDLKIFDTDKNQNHLKNILNTKELKNVDLILGTVSGTSNIEIAKFANQNKIVNFNFSKEDTPLKLGNYVYSSRSSYTNTGKQLAISARNIFDATKAAKIYFLSSKDKSDSIVAAAYKAELEALGIKVSTFKSVKTNIAEFKISLESTKDTETSHVAVFASENSILASTLISVWESNAKTTPILAPKEWLEIQLINYDQFYKKNVYFVYPDFSPNTNQMIGKLTHKHIEQYGVKPTSHTYLAMGYDLMMFAGKELGNYGTNFNSTFDTMEYMPLEIGAGINLNKSYSNSVVPIVKLDDKYNFIWTNNPDK